MLKRFEYSKKVFNRRGSLLTEGIIACIILGVAIGMLVPGLAAIGRQRQAMRFNTLAMIELNNIEAGIRKHKTLANDIKVSRWFSERYADASLAVEPVPDSEGVTNGILDGLRLVIRRPQADSMPDQKVSVVVWREKGEPTP